MDIQTFIHTRLWSQLFSSLVIFLLVTDTVTGSPFLPRPVARQFLTSADTARAKRERSGRMSGHTDTGAMELEGWQEVLTARKRTAEHIPTPRLRTLEKLRAVRQQVRHLQEDIDTISAQLEVGGGGVHPQDTLLPGGSNSNYGNTVLQEGVNSNHGGTVTEHRNYDDTQRPGGREVDGGDRQESETLEAMRAQLQALERSDYKGDPGVGRWED